MEEERPSRRRLLRDHQDRERAASGERPRRLSVVKPDSAPGATAVGSGLPKLTLNAVAKSVDWLRKEVGRPASPLAGMFYRGGDIIYTPRVGEEGYIPLDEMGDDGPAQIRILDHRAVQAYVQFSYRVVKKDEKGEVPVVFPEQAARLVCAAPDRLPALRKLSGVVHTPIVRRDGTVLDTPGYDRATGLLYLPPNGLVVRKVPETPTEAQIRKARRKLLEPIKEYQFETLDDRANYLGAMLTPFLKSLVPGVRKMFTIDAHNPGSGKTFLAQGLCTVHGGVFRTEIPNESNELRKQITSILSSTTSPVVAFDNIAGKLSSSILAGLLTSSVWDDRPMGKSRMDHCVNDRMWVVTGNNIQIGGDMPRRVVRIRIRPKGKRLQERQGFTIENLPLWFQENRSDLIWSALVLIRAWIVAGRPAGRSAGYDSYKHWIEALRGIMTVAGIEGEFDARGTQAEESVDNDDWSEFLESVYEVFGSTEWQATEVLALVEDHRPGKVIKLDEDHIPLEKMPTQVVVNVHKGAQVATQARTLGVLLAKKTGQWAGDFAVFRVENVNQGKKAKFWRIECDLEAGGD